jgi:hypothetical protein
VVWYLEPPEAQPEAHYKRRECLPDDLEPMERQAGGDPFSIYREAISTLFTPA